MRSFDELLKESSSHDGERLCKEDKQVVALVGPLNGNEPIPSFEPGSIKPLADLIEREVVSRSPGTGLH
ncbi:MAG TPA: hypothetical protein VFM35_08715 [Candidatus Binatia bacterium]|nr:hypothetical protein [Candidatus Binatia bacterium]